ncbi:bro-5 [Spodoptera litura granulovirus]|uniref:Bro-5 n=1 Tax=Spodoptera litura granulovirus TaxID=359919 RepID=A5IZW6_9BBAC|nr:bro-5 [Spodoptera litura granulovirus]ABQ52057.1 bro-5 [Spodoptera litura granulovirus]
MALINKKCNITGVECEVWIVEVEKDKFMYGGRNIAKFLGYKRPHKAIRDHVKPQWKCKFDEIQKRLQIYNNNSIPANWQPNTVFISEAGVYALIMRCKLHTADLFRQWLFEEVLPELRKNGRMVDDFCKYSLAHKQPTTSIMEYVYFITSPMYRTRHVYKIGTTRTPAKRVRQLNCGRPFDLLELDHCKPVHHFGLAVETMLLNKYKSQLLHGEWVQFTDDKQYEQAKKTLEYYVTKRRSSDHKPEPNVSSLLSAI